MKKNLLALTLAAALLPLAGCGNRTIRLDFVPTNDRLEPITIESADAPAFSSDKIAMITISGMITNGKAKGLLSSGHNMVSDFREALDAAAKDSSVKAVVLRINSPGGTVTASDMMYKDVLAFKAKTHKPVVVCMMDLCASGGYYISCAADYRIAYPTTITASIGVIMETVNINGTLQKIGVGMEAIKSAENKDMGSPFKPANSLTKPLSDNDRKLLQDIVDQFYAGFKEVVKASPHHIKEENWTMLTDGRVVTGKDAVGYGLVDQVGDLDAAINKAKQMANIQHAKIIAYRRTDDGSGSIYASSPVGASAQPQVNLLNVDVDLGDLIPAGHSEFLYLWTGGSGAE